MLWAIGAALVIAAAATFLLLRPSASSPASDAALIPASARRPAPSLEGGSVLVAPRITLAAAHGHVIYLNFWASWCAPCRLEAPAIRSFAHSLDPRRARFVGINVSDKRSAALAFIRRYHLTYPNMTDTNLAISRRYHIPGLPTTIVIDAPGRIAAELLGPQTLKRLVGTFGELSHPR